MTDRALGQEAEGGVDGHSATLRYEYAEQLFAALPQIGDDLDARPFPGETVTDFARRLLTTPAPEESVTFVAQMFNRRAAVWWGHECLRHLDSWLEPEDRELMRLAADWVAQPDDHTRQLALDGAMAAVDQPPGAWLAQAAGWSAGSIAPPGAPAVPPPRFLTGRAVNAAVLSALARVPNRHRQETLADFVSMALDLV